MPLYLDSFKNNPPEDFNSDTQINGVDSLRRSLEKYFFSEVVVRNCNSKTLMTNLAIELYCNMNLVEVLFHFNKGSWGNFEQGDTSFSQNMQLLIEQNDMFLDVGEFSLFFKDTTIIISKIYDNSIPEQLDAIFSEIGKNYVHFSKGLKEVPYEIYVPVFEECKDENDILIMNIEAGNNCEKDYFKYWALYFDSEDDAVIYDLRDSHLENGDLFMLNH
ncbi:MAG: hypothetical protein HKN31_06150 [Pricia sp.]|nr:hypothetical protein [Pricia sp.]